VLAVLLAAGLVAAFAFSIIRWRFAWYDDEGFMLLTLRQYLGGRALYDSVYTEYGPLYYVLLGDVFSLSGWPVTHDALRYFTLACWLPIAGGWAFSVWMWRRSLLLALAALATAAVSLRVLASGPGHPQMLVLLFCATAVTALSLTGTIGRRAAFFVTGAAAGAVLLTKINMGIFFLAGLAVVWAAGLPPSRIRRVFGGLLAVMCLALPPMLMRNHIALPAVALRSALYSFSLFALAVRLFGSRAAATDWSDAGWMAGGFAGSCIATLATVRAHGTSWTGLLDGVLLTPMRFSHAIQDSRPEPFALTFAALVAGVALWLLAMRRPAALAPWKPVVAAGILALALVSPHLLIAIVPGVLWMLAPEAGRPGRLPESLALFLGAFGLLMVYPVPGAQLAVAASLLLAGRVRRHGVARTGAAVTPVVGYTRHAAHAERRPAAGRRCASRPRHLELHDSSRRAAASGARQPGSILARGIRNLQQRSGGRDGALQYPRDRTGHEQFSDLVRTSAPQRVHLFGGHAAVRRSHPTAASARVLRRTIPMRGVQPVPRDMGRDVPPSSSGAAVCRLCEARTGAGLRHQSLRNPRAARRCRALALSERADWGVGQLEFLPTRPQEGSRPRIHIRRETIGIW
jgi:hypothetical protein